MKIDFRVISDSGDRGALPRIFREYWPAYRRWIGRSATGDLDVCIRALRRHMPEIVPIYESLLDRFGGGDNVARFLTMYNPPKLFRGCAMLVHKDAAESVLIRSYDHVPSLFDGVLLASDWLGRRTLAVTDCLWGVLDGVNEDGLAVALAFGGRNTTGDGFAAPLIARYLLETCAATSDARRALERLPVAMPYTFMLLDSTGDYLTAYLGPGRSPRFVRKRAATNHQGRVEWPAYASYVESVPRLRALEKILSDGAQGIVAESRFLELPLWRNDYRGAGGTLYVSRMDPGLRQVTLIWPNERRAFQVGNVTEEAFTVDLVGASAIR